jgi:hypothetical protein
MYRPFLELDDDPAFQRRTWAVQRAGWVVLAALLAGALFGLAGDGMLARATAVDGGGAVRLEYDRIARRHAEGRLIVRIAPGAARQGTIALTLSEGYLERVELVDIMPPPATTRLDGRRLVFEFPARGGAEATIMIRAEPAYAGVAVGRIGLLGHAPVSFRQYVLP